MHLDIAVVRVHKQPIVPWGLHAVKLERQGIQADQVCVYLFPAINVLKIPTNLNNVYQRNVNLKMSLNLVIVPHRVKIMLHVQVDISAVSLEMESKFVNQIDLPLTSKTKNRKVIKKSFYLVFTY